MPVPGLMSDDPAGGTITSTRHLICSTCMNSGQELRDAQAVKPRPMIDFRYITTDWNSWCDIQISSLTSISQRLHRLVPKVGAALELEGMLQEGFGTV